MAGIITNQYMRSVNGSSRKCDLLLYVFALYFNGVQNILYLKLSCINFHKMSYSECKIAVSIWNNLFWAFWNFFWAINKHSEHFECLFPIQRWMSYVVWPNNSHLTISIRQMFGEEETGFWCLHIDNRVCRILYLLPNRGIFGARYLPLPSFPMENMLHYYDESSLKPPET